MKEKIILIRTGDVVTTENGRVLPLNRQESKGPNREVVKIEGLPGSNGRKWLSLSLLKEGKNQLELKEPSPRNYSSKDYELTDDEKRQIDELERQKTEIIDRARERFVPRPKLNVNVDKLSNEEKSDYIRQVEKYLESLRG